MINSNVKKTVGSIMLATTVVSGLGLAASSAYAEPGFYVGGAYGQSRVNDSDFDDNNPARKLFIGGKFSDYIGIEAAANDYGKAESTGFSAELTGATLALVGYLPLTESFELFIKAGNLWWEDDVSVTGTPFEGTLDGEELFYGAGMNFNFNETIALRVELERYKVELSQSEIGITVDGSSNVDVASVGVVFNF